MWINGLKSAGVRALEFPPPPDHTRTLARDVPPVHRLTTCWAPRRTSPSLIPHLSPSIRHSTPLLPSYWSLSFLTHPLRLWYVSGCVTLSVSLGPQHRWFSGCESHTMRVDCCHLCVHNAFWLDVVCLSVYHKRPALALRPTVNRINGLGGCQRFSQLTVHSTTL